MNYKVYEVWEYSNGDKHWYKDGKAHREDDKPAVELSSGDKYWYKDGLPHRDGGPAVEQINGDKYWYKDGKYHREDGPAVEYISGNGYYYLNGKEYSKEEWYDKLFGKKYNIKGKMVSEDLIDMALKSWINKE